MLASVVVEPGTTARVLDVFVRYPGAEFQLLDIAGRARFSGELRELRAAADRLVAEGELELVKRHGARYYRLPAEV